MSRRTPPTAETKDKLRTYRACPECVFGLREDDDGKLLECRACDGTGRRELLYELAGYKATAQARTTVWLAAAVRGSILEDR